MGANMARRLADMGYPVAAVYDHHEALATSLAVELNCLAAQSLPEVTAAFVEREFSEITPGEGFMWDDENFPFSQTFVDDLRQIDNTLSAAETATQPWLLIHGDADDLVPVQDSRDAFEAANCEKQCLEIPGAGHSFDETNYLQLIEVVDRWLVDCFGAH